MVNEQEYESLVISDERQEVALQAAIELWTRATTSETSLRRVDLIRDKRKAVSGFFLFIKKLPGEVVAHDVDAWRSELEQRKLKHASVYAHISRLSSFYEWAMKDKRFEGLAFHNPVRL